MQRLKFGEEALTKLNLFLGKFERKTPRLYLVRLFIRAKVAGKNVFEIIVECQYAYDAVWRHGTPDRIGDPDDVTDGWGMKNASAFFSLYKNLGLPSPKGLY